MSSIFFDIDYRGVNANIAQIQVLAAVVRAMVQDEFNGSSSRWIASVPLPTAFNSWTELDYYCKKYKNMKAFRVLSDAFGVSEYSCEHGDHTQPDLRIYLLLSELQETFSQLEKFNLETSSAADIHDLTQRLVSSYMFLNNGIGSFFFNSVYERGIFSRDMKLYPVKINLDWMRELNGAGTLVIGSLNKKKNQKIFKVRLEELACQCRFMAFWSCLLQIITFPSLPKDMQDSFSNFVACLLKEFGSVYIHHIIVEQSDLNLKLKSKDRGALDNSTRLKVYFTLEDGLPLLARFDLSHKGVPFLHINLENEYGEVGRFNHCKLSLTEVEDNILKPLEDALMTFNYAGVKFKHAPTNFDQEMLHRVTLERAMFSTSIVEWFTLIFSDIYKKEDKESYDWNKEYKELLSRDAQLYIKDSYSVLAKEVTSYGINSEQLSNSEIFECVYDETIRQN